VSEPIPAVLLLARDARHAADPMSVTPSALWKAAQAEGGTMAERADLYRHAMLEAGHIISVATGRPYVVCPECGWRA
jgi:hypothetical protein